MDDLHRLKLSPEQVKSLPLGLRTIWFKDLSDKDEAGGHHFVEPYRAVVIPQPLRKPISRI
ncbi:hypothetical protein D7Y23_30295 [Corallococcus sp. AB050B]|nr:hypothetical protein D7Y23_30295 [Corallococcus sp. AB050B]